MLGSGRGGVVNEVSNLKANEQLTDTIEYMASREYQKQRDMTDVIPTHRRDVPAASSGKKGFPAYDPKAEKDQDRMERQLDSDVTGIVKTATAAKEEGSDDEDNELLELRRLRMMQMRQQQSKEAEWVSKQHGQFREIAQDEFFNIVVRERGGSENVVVHFYHKDFESCRVMDARLQELAPSMMSVKFVKIDAEKSPFLVERLRVVTLPCLVIFHNDIAVDRVLGFEGCMSADGTLDRTILRERIESAISDTEE